MKINLITKVVTLITFFSMMTLFVAYKSKVFEPTKQKDLVGIPLSEKIDSSNINPKVPQKVEQVRNPQKSNSSSKSTKKVHHDSYEEEYLSSSKSIILIDENRPSAQELMSSKPKVDNVKNDPVYFTSSKSTISIFDQSFVDQMVKLPPYDSLVKLLKIAK